MRIGIFGGTFNPIHLAHLRSAEEVCEEQGLDRIVFVPSATPPHKRRDGLASAEHRLAMAKRAIAGNPRFRVSRIEIDRGGPSYTIDTVRLLRARMPSARFALIIGMDAFREIGTWKNYAGIFALCDVIVTSRPGFAAPRLRAALPVAVRNEFWYRGGLKRLEHSTGNQIVLQRISDLDISASAIRQRLSRGLSIRYVVPPSVERYIAQHRLYARRVPSH